MVQLDGVVILSTVYDILIDLREELKINGINLLKDIKYREGKKDCQVTCPVHGGGIEKNPSCGISTRDIFKNGRHYRTGTVFCFTCGYKADLFEFVSYCWGTNQRDFGKRYVIRKYNTMDIAERPTIQLNFDRNTNSQPYKYINESVLNNYKYTSDYLIQRQFDINTILCYEYGLNKQNNTITMPVRDHKGGLVFIKQRFINPPTGQDKYLNESGIPKQYILYGFNIVLQLIKSINDGTCTNKRLEENYKKYGLALVEGEFNASYLMQNGIPAVSLLGRILFEDRTKKSVQQLELLLRYGIRKLVIWMDNDEHGMSAQTKIINQTNKYFKVYQPKYSMFPELNDANDYTSEQLNKLEFEAVF